MPIIISGILERRDGCVDCIDYIGGKCGGTKETGKLSDADSGSHDGIKIAFGVEDFI